MRTDLWPLFGLVVRTPRVELRYPDDDLIYQLAELSGEPVHDPAMMPFSTPWTDTPADQISRQSLQHFWLNRWAWSPTKWSCMMAVLADGELVGVQDMLSDNFAETKLVKTGSWLTQRVHGRGIGKEMRMAILHLGFDGLGAEYAATSAFHDNHSSLGVTRAVGYEPNGESIEMRRDKADKQLHFLMTRAQWQARRRDDITIEGLEPCLEMFGIAPS